jgi:hypothetical protein
VGLILDLAVVVLAGLVIASLALLAWTLAITSVRALQAERERVERTRHRVATAEDRLRLSARQASATLDELLARRPSATGDRPDR